jgi:SagB-type dehydrogenase family enzyme
MANGDTHIELPKPVLAGRASLEEAIAARRSVRQYEDKPLALSEISQLLWAAQGVIGVKGMRTAPSAGALYPLEIVLIAGKVLSLEPGIYRYLPDTHSLVQTVEGDRREELSDAALGQSSVRHAPAVFALTATTGRMTSKYRDRGIRYIWIETGHVAQNLCLQAASLGIGTVPVGAFNDKEVRNALGLSDGEEPLYLIPSGKYSVES